MLFVFASASFHLSCRFSTSFSADAAAAISYYPLFVARYAALISRPSILLSFDIADFQIVFFHSAVSFSARAERRRRCCRLSTPPARFTLSSIFFSSVVHCLAAFRDALLFFAIDSLLRYYIYRHSLIFSFHYSDADQRLPVFRRRPLPAAMPATPYYFSGVHIPGYCFADALFFLLLMPSPAFCPLSMSVCFLPLSFAIALLAAMPGASAFAFAFPEYVRTPPF